MTSDSTESSKLLRLVAEHPITHTIHTISDVAPCRTWDYSLPTYTSASGFLDRVKWKDAKPLIKTLTEDRNLLFGEILKAWNVIEPCSDDVKHGSGPATEFYKWKHSYEVWDADQPYSSNLYGWIDIVMFGGSLVHHLTKEPHSVNDYDFKLVYRPSNNTYYKLTEEQSIEAISHYIDRIFNVMEKLNNEEAKKTTNQKSNSKGMSSIYYDPELLNVSRIGNCVHIEHPQLLKPLDITFECEYAVAEIFRKCAPVHTAIALYRGEILFSPLAKYCFENLCFPLIIKNVNREVTRVVKYVNQGYDLVLLDLDMDKIPKRNLEFKQPEILDLPHFLFLYNNILGNKILRVGNEGVSINPRSDAVVKEASNSHQSAYEDMLAFTTFEMKAKDNASNLDFNRGKDTHWNTRAMVQRKYDCFVFAAQGLYAKQVLKVVPTLTKRSIGKVYETVKATIMKGNAKWDVLYSYFNVRHVATIMDDVLIKPLSLLQPELGGAKKGELKNSVGTVVPKYEPGGSSKDRHSLYTEYIESYVDQLILEQSDLLTKELEELPAKMEALGYDQVFLKAPGDMERISKHAIYGTYCA